MELIIDIPEEKYHDIVNMAEEILDASTSCSPRYLYKAVLDGAPLPKGHGDLIDRNDLLKHYDSTTYYNGIEERKIHFVQIGYVNDAPTIIEADKAESEK